MRETPKEATFEEDTNVEEEYPVYASDKQYLSFGCCRKQEEYRKQSSSPSWSNYDEFKESIGKHHGNH
jgi:hypothetical protein